MPKTGHVLINDSEPSGPPPLHLRGGSIIAMTLSSSMTKTSSKDFKSLNLVVLPSKVGTAYGDLFWDDRQSLETIEQGAFNFYEFVFHSNCSLDVLVTKRGFNSSQPSIERITIGHTRDSSEPIVGSLDGKAIKGKAVNGLTVFDINFKLEISFTLEWKDCNLLRNNY